MKQKLLSIVICLALLISACTGNTKIDSEVNLDQFLIESGSNVNGIGLGDSLEDVEKLAGNKLLFTFEDEELKLKKYILEGEYFILEIPCRITIEFIEDRVTMVDIIIDSRTETKENAERMDDFELLTEKLIDNYEEPDDEFENSFENEYGKFDTLGYRWISICDNKDVALQMSYMVVNDGKATISISIGEYKLEE